MEESFKKLEKEVQTKDVETGEKKVTREDRGCTGLVQGGDETHKMNEISGKGKGKGNGGKGEHGGKGDKGSKGVQQSAKMMKGEEEQKADEEDERGRVAPNMGGRWLTPPGHVGPQEERRGEEKGTSAVGRTARTKRCKKTRKRWNKKRRQGKRRS